jgi:predicted dehydrogenase
MSGGGVLMEKGCHDLSQLVEIFGEASIQIIDSDVTWKGTLDVAVEATLRVGPPHRVDIDFRISMVEPYQTRATFEFSDASVTFEHPEADDSLRVAVAGSRRGIGNMTIAPDTEAAQTTEEAMYLRWQSFLDGLWDGFDSERETYLDVSRLVTELYEKADPPAEVTG